MYYTTELCVDGSELGVMYTVCMTMTTTRIESFSDGVIAIVITLLVLDLHVPILALRSEPALFHALFLLLPKLIVFAFSFLVIAIFWVNHDRFFSLIEKSDRALLWNNIFLLFWISLIPFPTALLGTYPQSPTAVVFYGLVLLMASLAFLWMRHRALPLFSEKVSNEILDKQRKRSMMGPLLYALGIFFASFSVYISYVCFVLVPLFYFLPSQYHKTLYENT